jgi:hypothetical protein
MPYDDDLPLETGRAPAGAEGRDAAPARLPPSRLPSVLRWVLVIAGAMAAGAALTFWWMSRTQPAPVEPAPTTATDVPLGANRPSPDPMPLPPLDDSDTFFQGLVSTLSEHPVLARLLATKGLVRSGALAVVQIGDGKTPATPLTVLRPSSRLQVAGSPSGQLDPRSYDRWNGAVAALTSIEPASAAQLYVNVKPLFDEAYRELGQGSDFDAAIVAAIAMLSETPALDDDPVLARRPGYFEHEDADLRALRPVQKQFLLIGPDNRAAVLRWLNELATHLDLTRLP